MSLFSDDAGADAAETSFAVVERFFEPTQAYIVQGCLRAAGIAAHLADANLVQMHGLLTPALGGVRLLVPTTELDAAHALIAAYRRGELALDEDVDVGEPGADQT